MQERAWDLSRPAIRAVVYFAEVMSASVKPRLAGRQPSDRGGVLRVMTRPDSSGKRGSCTGQDLFIRRTKRENP